jgi:HAD superfamily hydrolase (TIGR01509 family)
MRRFIGRTRKGCIDHATELLGRPLPDGFAQAWDAALFEAFERELKAIEGVAELLSSLTLPYCVASNSSPDRMRVALRAARLLANFEGRMFSATEVANPKPAPDLFLHAARMMNTEPAGCIVIEDTLTGVRAGVAAGMKVFGYAAGVPSRAAAMATEGARPFNSMSELAARLLSA